MTYFLEKKNLRANKFSIKRKVEKSRMSPCWKSFRSNYILVGCLVIKISFQLNEISIEKPFGQMITCSNKISVKWSFSAKNFRSNGVWSNSDLAKWFFGQMVFGEIGFGQLTFRSKGVRAKFIWWSDFFVKMNQNPFFYVKLTNSSIFVTLSDTEACQNEFKPLELPWATRNTPKNQSDHEPPGWHLSHGFDCLILQSWN
jgi:hypothetical protein